MAEDQSKKFRLPSGACLSVTVAPFGDAWSLMKATLKSLKGLSISEDVLRQELSSFVTIPAILDKVIAFATSDEVESGVFQCARRALYIPLGSPIGFPGIPVDHGLFDDPTHGEKAREDYAHIIARILEVNCKPFLVRALSGFLSQEAKSSGNQKSETLVEKP